MTTAERLTLSEKEKLNINDWYVAIKNLSEKDIRLLFQRIREEMYKRVNQETSEEDVKRLPSILLGVVQVEAIFLEIKKETIKNS